MATPDPTRASVLLLAAVVGLAAAALVVASAGLGGAGLASWTDDDAGHASQAALQQDGDGGGDPDSVLYLWTGDKGPGTSSPASDAKEFDAPDDEDFLAVVDADPDSATYGKVIRTVEVPGRSNEPHHMQPFVPDGCETVFAGGLFSDLWFNFDVSDPLEPTLANTITPAETRGTVPDAAFVLPNCQALATEMGGDPSTGSYVGGPHGAVVRMTRDEVVGSQLADRVPQDTRCESQWNPSGPPGKPGGPFTRKTSEDACLPSNPHGIWARPDLGELVTSDYATPGQLIQAEAPTSSVAKLTVRHYDLADECLGEDPPATPGPAGTDCISDPTVVLLPDGPRDPANEGHEENVGVMETATTHPAGDLNPTGETPDGYLPSKGAFAATMCGGALYYAPNISAEKPEWREVYDFTAAGQEVDPDLSSTAGCAGGGAVVPTPDNRYLLHAIIGREPGQSDNLVGSSVNPDGFPGMVVMLDIRALVQAGEDVDCHIDTNEEVWSGGSEADCPTFADAHVVPDVTSGGPHFFSYDFPGWNDGRKRVSFFNYFVSETGVTGDTRVCMLEVGPGQLQLDDEFPASVDGQKPGSGCISFNRADWPDDRGAGAGPAKPHYGLFVETT